MYSDLLKSLTDSGVHEISVLHMACSAREGDLPFMMLHFLGPFGKQDMVFIFFFIKGEKYSSRGQGGIGENNSLLVALGENLSDLVGEHYSTGDSSKLYVIITI